MYLVWFRPSTAFTWSILDAYDSATEAERFVPRYLLAGQYVVLPAGTRPTADTPPTFRLDARALKARRPRRRVTALNPEGHPVRGVFSTRMT